MKKLVLILAFISAIVSNAQTIWQSSNQLQLDKITDDSRATIPSQYDLIDINPQALSSILVNAVDRFSNGASIPVDFPLGNDQFETFNVYDSGAVSQELQIQFPNIRSYIGQSQQNPLNKIYFTITPQGFRGLITGDKILYMDPFADLVPNTIMIYDRKDLKRQSDDNFACGVVDVNVDLLNKSSFTGMETKIFRDRQFRTYRLAVAATAEYTAYHDDGIAANGNAVADAMAGIVTTITRVNSIFEKEMSIRFSLIGNNSSLIYTDPNNDPYDNYSAGQMISVNTNNINTVLGGGTSSTNLNNGASQYDVGHVFSTGGGGLASSRRCGNRFTSKASGVTGIVTPEFDPFDIDYVSHELGHQFGANHTFYNGCFGGSPSPQPYETGSASTIMGYAGICAPNVQDNSDAYFHAISLQEMHATMEADTCDVQISLGSNNPTAPNAQDLTEKFIPIGTPFKLTAISTQAPDAGEVYTYRWDQLDTGAAANTGATQPPVGSNTSGPMFRSKFATTDPTRYFPNLEEVLNGTDDIWETLSTVSREMTFVSTIYDNNINGGQTDQAEVIVKPNTGFGPFLVLTPVGADVWYEGQSRTVTWDVANTNQTAGATEVNVKLSLDGGYTYPFTLASNVSNTGSRSVTIPTGAKTDNARIMVEAVGNYFYNVNNGNFEIKEGTFELTAATVDFSVCQPSDGSISFEYNAAPDFNEVVTFSATGLPVGLTASFTPSTTTSDTTVNVIISGTAAVDANQYDFSIQAQATSATITKDFTFKVFDNNVGELVQTLPINGAANQVPNPLLEWEDLASASSYLVEISQNSNFSTIVESGTVNFQNTYQPSLLEDSTLYYWRVTPSNDCITGTSSSISLFQTAQDVCITYDNETYENTAQPSNRQNEWNTSINAVSAKVVVTDDIEVTNLSFYMKADHNDTGDLKMQLSAPTGRFAEVYNRECASGRDFDLIVSDQGTQNFGCNPGSTAALTGNQRPGQAFSRFNNASALGEWVLLATDRESTIGGTFEEFSVTVCGRLQYVNDINNNRNNLLTIPYNASSVINQTLLRTQQTGTTNVNMVYVLTKLPQEGVVELNSVALDLGDTFTQADLNNDRIEYIHDSTDFVLTDSFDYTVLGNSNTLMNAQTFNIEIEEPTLIYDMGWTPFAPNEATGSLNAQVINGLATIPTDAEINNLEIIGVSNSLSINSSITIYGDLTLGGSVDALQGEIILAGTTAQVVTGDGFIDAGQLTIENTNGVTLNSILNVHGVLSPTNSTINTNGNVIFRSDANSTAQLDDASAATINGLVQVERYIPARRAFRLVASAVNSTGSIYENWQENGNNTPGLGTHITGSATGANGFDSTSSGNSSMFRYDALNSSWVSQANTDTQNLQVGDAYRLMIRGDRTIDLTQNNATPTNTVLRATGDLHTGDFNTSVSTNSGDFLMVANPYQANVDFKIVLNDVSTSGVNTNFAYYWDPNLNTRGGYATLDMNTLNGDALPSSSNANKYLQPGQSVFLIATGATALTFKESHKRVKVDVSNIFSQPQYSSSLVVGLLNRNTQSLIDQSVIKFNAAYNSQVDNNDAIKFYNQDETLAIVNAGSLLSIDNSIMPVIGDRILLHTDRFRTNQYSFKISLDGILGTQPVLVDHFNGQRTNLAAGDNIIDFDVISGDTASNNLNRFEIIFENGTLTSGDLDLENQLTLFPNPVTRGQFTIQSSFLNNKDVTITLYNTLGQLIHQQQSVFNNSEVVNPRVHLSSGMYFVKVATVDESAVLQVIVK